jgi:hypothetical protein
VLFLLAFLASAMLLAQGTTPKANASDYPAHAAVGDFTLAAEYLVHSIPAPEGSFFTEDYLVVEAAFFGPPLARVKMSAEHFTLRINGRKAPLMTQSPGIVGASLKYPDWEQRPTVTASAGPVILGGPVPVERFPGDPNARRGPAPPRVPESENPGGQAKEPAMPIEERIQRAALPEGEHVAPAGGLLFFPFRGKTKSIRSLELLYDGPAGKVSLKLL